MRLLVEPGGIGQAAFSWDPAGPMGARTYVVEEPVERTREERLLGSRRHDADGSVWAVVDVDLDALESRVSTENLNEVEAEAGLDLAAPEGSGTTPDVEQPGDEVTWFPTAWQFGDCDGSGGLFATAGDNFYWNGTDDDDRVLVAQINNRRRKAIVEIQVSGVTKCTGVILRQQEVLTAAHCFYDANDNPIDPDSIQIVRRDSVAPTVIGYGHRHEDLGFDPPDNLDPKDDYATVYLDADLAAPYSDMDISAASDQTISGLDNAFNLALPQFAPGCTPNLNGLVVDDMYLNTDEKFGSVYNEKVNIKMDGGPGHSGSPVFYCPEGGTDWCEDEVDETGYVLAVWSGWNGFETTNVGAKAPVFRQWAIDIMDGHP